MKRHPISAFSLVEVALSLAILAVGMTGVLALLPVGLDSARQVHAETIAAQIVRTVQGEIIFSNRASRSFLGFPPLEFDAAGKKKTDPSERSYFRLTSQQVLSGANLARYFLTLNWPADAPAGSRLAQTRTFVVDSVRDW